MNTVMDSSSVRRKLFVLVQIALMLSLPVRACPTVVQNPLSIGRVDNCVSPRTNISTECQGIITWDVPEAMSSLSSIKDAYIRGILEQIDGGAEDEACTDGIRHMLCTVEYPRCLMNISQVDTAISREEDCRDRLSSCTSSRQVFCDFLITDGVALDKCRTIDDYAITYNYNFTFCNRLTSPDWLNTYVTEWMFLYLINIDEEIKKIDDKNLLTFPRNTDCEQQYLFFKCNSIGRCWNQGTQIELIVNQSDCEVVRSNCFNNLQTAIFGPEFQCEVWRSDSDLATEPTITTQSCPDPSSVVTSRPNSTPSVTPTSVTTTSTSIVLPTSTHSGAEINSASSASASVLLILIALLCVHFCVIQCINYV